MLVGSKLCLSGWDLNCSHDCGWGCDQCILQDADCGNCRCEFLYNLHILLKKFTNYYTKLT